jgi:hypothetical protein
MRVMMTHATALKADWEPTQRANWGFFTICQKIDGKMPQRSYRVDKYDKVMSKLDLSVDTYISQNVFKRPNRRTLDLQSISHGYVDLDTYNIDRLSGMSAEDIAKELLKFCDVNNIRRPSMIIDSGQGLYLKYVWSTLVHGRAAGRAIAVNRKLVETFKSFGADPKCVDMSRILRVVGSINSKTGRLCRVVWSSAPIQTYSFDKFADEVLPYTYEQVKSFRQKKAKLASLNQVKGLKKIKTGKSDWAQFHWKVLMDLQTLKQMRYGNGYVKEGMRDIFGFLGAVQLAHALPNQSDLFHELRVWVSQNGMLSEGFTQKELLRSCSSLLDRLYEQRAGKTRTFQGKKVSPLYTYSIQKMIELLEITSVEMKNLSVLIDDIEKKYRNTKQRRKKRRKSGMLPRGIYLKNAFDKSLEARQLKASGLSVSKIVERLGISRSSVYEYLKA